MGWEVLERRLVSGNDSVFGARQWGQVIWERSWKAQLEVKGLATSFDTFKLENVSSLDTFKFPVAAQEWYYRYFLLNSHFCLQLILCYNEGQILEEMLPNFVLSVWCWLGPVIYCFAWAEQWSFYIQFTQDFCHGMMYFIRCLLCIYWDNRFFFFKLIVKWHVYWAVYVEPSLHTKINTT